MGLVQGEKVTVATKVAAGEVDGGECVCVCVCVCVYRRWLSGTAVCLSVRTNACRSEAWNCHRQLLTEYSRS